MDLVESSMLISIKYKLRRIHQVKNDNRLNGILTCKQQSQCNWIYNLFLFLRWPQPRRVDEEILLFFKIKRRLVDAEMFQENWTRAHILQMYVVLPRFSEAFYKYKMTQLAKFRKTKAFSFKAKFQVFCTMLIFLLKNTLRHFLKIFIPLVLCLKLLNFPAQKCACAIFLKTSK